MRNCTLSFFIISYLLTSCSIKQNHNIPDVQSAALSVANLKAYHKLAPPQFVNWIRDKQHGLKKEKTIEDIMFSAQYKPVDYIICQEERSEQLKEALVNEKRSELKEMQYIDLKISLSTAQGELLKYDLTSGAQYDERVKYFSFKMQNDIKLIEGKDTLACTLFHFERGYDAAPYSTFVLGFPIGNNNSESKTLVYHDNVFKKGIIKLEFATSALNSIPQLETIQ